MAPLIILTVCFGITLLTNKFLLKEKLSLSLMGRISLSIMLIATGIAHFTHTEQMIQMMPEIVFYKKEVVYFTGILELMASAGLLIPKLTKLASILLILFFIAVLPANIVGSMKQVSLGGMEKGVSYLYFRIPLQMLFILWAYYFGIRKNKA